MTNLRPIFPEHHAYGIEPDLKRIVTAAAQVIPRGANHFPFLRTIDIAIGSAMFLRGAALYLDEYQRFPLARHHIQFPASRWRPVIPRHNVVALLLQEPVREILALTAQRPLRSPLFPTRRIALVVAPQQQPLNQLHLFNDFELELHHLAADDEAEVVFPELPKPQPTVHQQFEPEIPPKR